MPTTSTHTVTLHPFCNSFNRQEMYLGQSKTLLQYILRSLPTTLSHTPTSGLFSHLVYHCFFFRSDIDHILSLALLRKRRAGSLSLFICRSALSLVSRAPSSCFLPTCASWVALDTSSLPTPFSTSFTSYYESCKLYCQHGPFRQLL